MKLLILCFIFSLSAFSQSSIDLISNGRLNISTKTVSLASFPVAVNCASERNFIVTGAFSGTEVMNLTTTNCKIGTRFVINNLGTGDYLFNIDGVPTNTLQSTFIYNVFYDGTWRVFAVGSTSPASPFSPSASVSIIPATSLTYDLGSLSSVWANIYTRYINNGGVAGSVGTPGNFTNRLMITTKELPSGQSSGTSTIWIKSGDNATPQYTGSVAITTGTNNNTTGVTGVTGDIFIATGQANTSTGTNTGTFGGITLSAGGAPLTTTNASTTTISQNAGGIRLLTPSTGFGRIEISSLGGVSLATGPLLFTSSATTTIGQANCPVGSCTSAAPFVLSPLFPTQPTACSTNSSICTSQVVIELSSASWSGNTADKYVCVAGIQKATNVGQKLIVRVSNGTGGNGATAKVVNLIVGFASPQTPITGCTYTGSPSATAFKLKFTAAPATNAGGAFPATSSFLPRNQFIMSSVDPTSATFQNRSAGGIEFVYQSNPEGWVEL